MSLLFAARLALMVLLLAFSFLFSGAETAAFSLNPLEKARLRREKPHRFLLAAIGQPEEILTTILLGNMIVNLLFASLMDTVVAELRGDDSQLLSIAFGSAALLILGEMTPKNVAIRHAAPFFAMASPLLAQVHAMLAPIRRVLDVVRKGVVAFVSGRLRGVAEDRRTLVLSTLHVGLRMGLLHPSELAATESFLEFRDKTAYDVMIPRTRLVGVDEKAGFDAAIECMRTEGGKRPVLVYEGDIDHLKGYLVARDLLAYRYGLGGAKDLGSLLRPFYPVPETKPLLELMREMIERRIEMALVLDEYGGTSGVIPFPLIFEDFLRFFYSSAEFHPEAAGPNEVATGVYRIPGEFRLEDLEYLFGCTIEADSRTVGGFIVERLGEIPSAGASLSAAGLRFVVKRVSQRQILEVEVSREP